MWRTIRTFILIFGCIYAFKSMQKYDREMRIKTSVELALDTLVQAGVQHPEVALAQMLHETDYFKSRISRENWNAFGMKASSRNFEKGSQYGHALYDHKDHLGSCKIGCYKSSIKDYAAWQKQMLRGRTLSTQGEYLYFLEHLPGGFRYAEDPNYTEKLRSILIIIDKCKSSYSRAESSRQL